MTVQWDYAEQKDEWVNKFDIVYSNSFDHSFDPQKTIDTWREQLNGNGRIYLEYSEHDSIPNHPSDCVDAKLSEVKELIENSGLNIIKEFKGSQTSVVLVCERNV